MKIYLIFFLIIVSEVLSCQSYIIWSVKGTDLTVIFSSDTISNEPVWIVKNTKINRHDKVKKIGQARVSMYEKKLTVHAGKKKYIYNINIDHTNTNKNEVLGLVKIEDPHFHSRLLNKLNRSLLLKEFQSMHFFCIDKNSKMECDCSGGPGALTCECGRKNLGQKYFISVFCSDGFYACCTSGLFLN